MEDIGTGCVPFLVHGTKGMNIATIFLRGFVLGDPSSGSVKHLGLASAVALNLAYADIFRASEVSLLRR